MSTSAITTDGLTKRYGDRTAVADLSLDVAEGEVFGYLGRNGSGKTTTVRMLTTLTSPTAGRAEVAGIDVTRTLEVRRRIGVTLQEAALDPAMTGAEHLELVAGLWGLRRADATTRARELVELFGLTAAAEDRIGTYSGGMQRRLDIAAALVTKPHVLFLDEPTTGLDPQSRRALWNEIRRLQDDGVTVFLTTQYLEEADELATRLAVIDAGRIIAEGTPSQLKAAHGRTTVTLDVDEPPERVLATFNRTRPDARVEPAPDGRVALSLPAEAAGAGVLAVLDTIRGAGIEPRQVNVAEASLEDVYLRLTGSDITGDTTSTETPVAEPA